MSTKRSDLVFLALGAVLACMTQMDVVQAIPVEVARVGIGSAVSQHGRFEVLSVSPNGLTLNGASITEDELIANLTNKRVVLRAHRTLPTEKTIQVIAKLAQAQAEVSLEVQEFDHSDSK